MNVGVKHVTDYIVPQGINWFFFISICILNYGKAQILRVVM